MRKATLRANLISEIDGIVAKYERLSESSYEEIKRNLLPGEKIPPRGGLHTQKAREAFRSYRDESRARVNSAIDEAMKTINNTRSTTPPADVSNALLLMSARNNLTEVELQSFHDVHGKNYQVDQALRSIAAEKRLSPAFMNSYSQTTGDDEILHIIKKNINNFIDVSEPSRAFAEFEKMGLDRDLSALSIE